MTDRSPTDPTDRHGHILPEDLSALVDGEAGEAPTEVIDTHLASCERCRRRHEELAQARLTLRGLSTPAPAGSAAAAVAAALDALSTDGAGALAALHRRQRRIRLAGIAATVVLVAGGVTGVVLAAHGGGSSSAAPGLSSSAASRRAAGGDARPTGAAPGRLFLGRSEHVQGGPASADLVPSDVAGYRVRQASDGSFTATIALRPGHLLSLGAIAALNGSRASAFVGGRAVGVVHVLSPRIIEITGLTKAESSELNRLFR